MKKGFTLIELVAVIFILGLIMLIVVPIVTDKINNSKTTLSSEQVRQIETAARQWGIDNLSIKNDKPVDASDVEINSVSINTLQKSGYLDDKAIIDATTKSELDNHIVCVSYENNQFVYEYKGEGDC